MTSPESNQRKFLRHPTEIPIDVEIADVVSHQEEYLNNISFGGLCFKSKIFLDAGRIVHIKIPLLRPVFEARGKVAWCAFRGDHFDVGVEFVEVDEAFKIRMAEQICMIEQYQKDALEKEGRKLTSTEAALEWINKYAKDFTDK